ncbi:MAG: MerR family transcriptional regulator [Candidatus Geothermincolia bacterium]
MANDEGRPLKISDLEDITGLSRGTIHYYVREGLVSPPRKTSKTMAYYNAEHVDELREIRKLRESGYPVSRIREMTGRAGAGGRAAGPKKQSAESDKKRQIMDKAVEIFARKGYHQTKVTDITDALGLGHSTFYIYFPSKLALFIDCIDRVFEAMFAGVWQEIRDEKNPLRRLRKRGEVVLKNYPQFVDVLQVLHSTVEDDPRLETRRKDIYASIAMTVKGDLAKAVEEGLLPPIEDIDIMSYLLVGFLETASLLMSINKSYTADKLLDAIAWIQRTT